MTRRRSTTQAAMVPPEGGVTVRMYRSRGLGDCFLLAFRAGDGSGRYVLIDCGVFFATKGGAERMRAIARDIDRVTGGHLHVLVGTHEHWDHLSGFKFAQSTFESMTVDQVWLPWTEDLDDPLARRLRERREQALRALMAAVTHLKGVGVAGGQRIEEVLHFHGGLDDVLGLSSTADMIDHLRTAYSSPHYCQPGEPPLTVPGVDGVRAYVLGPPRNEELLSRSNPSNIESEVYERGLALDDASTLYVAALAADEGTDLTDDERELLERSYPFERLHRIPLQGAADHWAYGAFFRSHYGFASDAEHGPPWRRIGFDWLEAVGTLALDLDDDTNNTGLVLAIELAESGRVLLFPADAQVGNWLSWHDVSWAGGPCEGDAEITGSELVRRTVLYKVGHHGSHNATLREKGLEMMSSPELVAMIPVDAAQAQQKEWAMPFEPLLERLEEKTRGRVLRADTGLPEKPEDVTTEEWSVFEARTAEDDLWVQYTVPG